MLRFILYPLIFICSFNESVHSNPRNSYSEDMKSKIKSILDGKENTQIQKKNLKFVKEISLFLMMKLKNHLIYIMI